MPCPPRQGRKDRCLAFPCRRHPVPRSRRRAQQLGQPAHKDLQETRQCDLRRGAPMRRPPSRRVRTNSSRAASGQISMTCAPGSPTEEIARMLETEPQNQQPDPNEPEGNRQSSGQEGSQRRGLLRRTRRSVAKPAEAPEFKSGEPDAQPDTARAAGSGRESGGSQSKGRAARPVPAVPGMPSADPDDQRGAAARANQPVPAAAFQAPVLVFQPPDLSERRPAESGRSQPAESGRSQAAPPADDAESPAGG